MVLSADAPAPTEFGLMAHEQDPRALRQRLTPQGLQRRVLDAGLVVAATGVLALFSSYRGCFIC